MMEFPEHFRELEQRIIEFLRARNKGYRLWDWALKVPLLDDRLATLLSNEDLSSALQSQEHGMTSVLDLGCGLCMYWPFLYEWGFTRFVGVDLYRMRGLGAQEYRETAEALVATFCPNASFDIHEDDVRNVSDELDGELFDLIFTKNTNYQKLGSTGIPRELFDSVVTENLLPGGIAVYAG